MNKELLVCIVYSAGSICFLVGTLIQHFWKK